MEQLKRLRIERGLSQARLAARAELDPSTVNQIERGAREASPATLRKLAEALDVGLAELLEDVSPKVPAPSPELPFNGLEGERRIDFAAYANAIDGFTRYWDRQVRVKGRTLDRQELQDFLEAVRAIVLSLSEVRRAADAQDRRLMRPSLQRFVVVANAVGQLAEDRDAAASALADTLELLEAAA